MQTALITGTSRGIGQYIARSMGKAGYNLVLVSRSATEVEALAVELRAAGAIRDAGQGQRTSDELGMKMPRAGTSPASDVAKAVLTAIRKDRTEIVVMPGPGRLLKAVMDLFPGFGPAMNQMAGANEAIRKVIELRKSE